MVLLKKFSQLLPPHILKSFDHGSNLMNIFEIFGSFTQKNIAYLKELFVL